MRVVRNLAQLNQFIKSGKPFALTGKVFFDYVKIGAKKQIDDDVDEDAMLPEGGSTGQVLKKDSGADHDVSWQNESGGGGGGTTVTFFQVEDDGVTGQLTTGSAADLAGMWGSPSQTHADFSWNGTTGILTVNTTGTIEFNIKVCSWNNANNRHELHAQIYKNGSTVIVEDAQYASRNNTQDEGSVYINGFLDSATAGDTYRIRIFDIGVAATVGAANVAGMTYLSAKLYV